MELIQEMHRSLRALGKSPGFLILVVVTLAFGIGANTTVFSIAQAVILRAVNFPDTDRLMFLSRGYPGYPQGGGNFTYPAYRMLSHGFWQREFAGADVIGRVIHLNQQEFAVIGVTAPSFRDAPGEIDNGEAVDAWLPLGLSHRMTSLSGTTDRNSAISGELDTSRLELHRKAQRQTLPRLGCDWQKNIRRQTVASRTSRAP